MRLLFSIAASMLTVSASAQDLQEIDFRDFQVNPNENRLTTRPLTNTYVPTPITSRVATPRPVTSPRRFSQSRLPPLRNALPTPQPVSPRPAPQPNINLAPVPSLRPAPASTGTTYQAGFNSTLSNRPISTTSTVQTKPIFNSAFFNLFNRIGVFNFLSGSRLDRFLSITFPAGDAPLPPSPRFPNKPQTRPVPTTPPTTLPPVPQNAPQPAPRNPPRTGSPTTNPTPSPSSSRKFAYQYGAGFLQYWSPERHLINELKMQGYRAASARVDGTRLSFEDLVNAGHFDVSTNKWMSLPKNRNGDPVPIQIGIFRGDANDNPSLYTGDYAITWDGNGTVDFAFGAQGNMRRINANRIETSFTLNDARWSGLSITSIKAGGVSNVRAFRRAEEDKLNAGQTWSSHWLDFISGYEVVRFMDIALTNDSIIRKTSQIAREQDIYWNASTRENMPSERVRSFPIALKMRACVQAGCIAWINMPALLGAPSIFDSPDYIEEISSPGINFLRDRAAAHTDEIIASNETRKWADRVVAALDAENYPTDRPIYLEVGNEVWNFGGPFARATHYMWGIARGLGLDGSRSGLPRTETRGGYGYLSAKLAHEFEQALADAGREQSFKIVIGTHTAFVERTQWALEGAALYFARNGLSRNAWMQKLSVATTSYYNGGFHYREPQGGIAQDMFDAGNKREWLSKWRNRLESNEAAFSDFITDHLINGPASVNGTKAWIVERTQRHKEVAADFGAEYIGQYEGGSHDTLDRDLRNDPRALKFFRDFRQSENAARIQKAVYDALIEETPGAIISDFTRFCSDQNDPKTPWCEQTSAQSVTPLTEALDSYLKPTN